MVAAEDRYGLPLTASGAAAARYGEAMDLALSARAGAIELLEEVVAEEPGFALARALLGLQLRSAGRMGPGSRLVLEAAAGADGTTEREASHLAVLGAFAGSRMGEALALATAHLARWPGDAIVLMQAHFLHNIFDPSVDRRHRHLRLVEGVAERVGDDWYVLGEVAFATGEAGRHAEARELAERSLEQAPWNAMAAHPLAHAHLEEGSNEAGAAWLAAWLDGFDRGSSFRCHLTWHLALLRLGAGHAGSADVDAVLAHLGASQSAGPDAVALLWRLHLDGVADLPWDAVAGALPPTAGFAFGDLHRGLALSAAGDVEGLRALAEALEALGARGGEQAAACAEAVRALGHLAAGEPGRAADGLLALGPRRASIGGSCAQLEVVEDTLVAALAAAGRRREAAAVLDDRLRRRHSTRDERWRARLA